MSIYLFNIVLLIFWKTVLLSNVRIQTSGKKYFCIVASFQWFILSAFRHLDIGSDTWYYGQLFDEVARKSWTEIFQESIAILKGTIEGRDVGYVILEKALSCIWNDYRFLLIFVAALLAITLGKFIYDNSHDVFFSYLLFSCLFYNFFAITGQRQTIATCIVVFGGYGLIRDRKVAKFLLLTILMSFIHKSCLIYITLYFLASKKIDRKYLTYITVISVLCFVLRNKMFTFFAIISGYDKLYNIVEGAGAKTFTLLLFMVFVTVLFYHKIIIRTDKCAHIWINALCLAVIFVPLTFVEPNTMRIVQYFSIYLMLLIPVIIECVRLEQQAMTKFVIESLLIILFISTEPVYYFM